MPDSASPSDPDRRLAARIGAALDRGEPLASVLSEDEVGQALRTYRQREDRHAPDAAASERMWTAIAEATRDADSDSTPDEERTPIVQMPTVRRWAVAAVVLLAVGLAWMLFRTPDPVVVAQSETDIVTYTAPDGSTVRLRPHSTLTRLPDDDALRFRLNGEAAFAVESRPEASPFLVEARTGQVRVVGTRFVVRTWTDQPEVILTEGQVEWTNTASGQSATLVPGQQARAADDGGVIVESIADAERPLAWLKQELVLDQRTVQSVVAELEQHFALTIRVPDAVAQETVSGRILLDGPASTLRDLGTVLGGRFEWLDGQTYRFVQPSTTRD